jgi:hypothetical protein
LPRAGKQIENKQTNKKKKQYKPQKIKIKNKK